MVERMNGRIVCVAGARPNFMKVAPILAEMRRRGRLEPSLIHTGQHYDAAMSEAFFRDLDIPEPDVHLGVGSESAVRQTARVMERIEPELQRIAPACVVVVGDVNSTLAATIAAAKLDLPIAHVEAGLRSRDRRMPEELNRILTDAASEILLTPSRDADANLIQEGIPAGRIFFVGNVMIDSLRRFEEQSRSSTILDTLGLEPGRFALATLHRPSNVDRPEDLARVAAILEGTARHLPVVFPVHPRTRARLVAEGFEDRWRRDGRILLRPPEGYLDFLRLMSAARVVLTDSGGIQEETTALGVACLTIRENTERPVTIREGTNRLAGTDPDKVLGTLAEELDRTATGEARIPELWDGQAAERIVGILEQRFAP